MHVRIRGSRDRGRATGWGASGPSIDDYMGVHRFATLACKRKRQMALCYFLFLKASVLCRVRTAAVPAPAPVR